ncbi:LruC domain-containing protein [Parabacteroides sp. PF5-6]|nr:LruC domain-containing protein [Parabacteroides sp. PF5-6]
MTTHLNLKSVFFVALSFLFAISLQSCWDEDVSEDNGKTDPITEEPTDDDFFDFNMKEGIDLSIDYGFSDLIAGGNYQVLFNLYDEMPYDYDQAGNRTKKEGLLPLYSAWTDKTGKFSGTITLPSALKTVFLACNHFGALGLVEVPVANGTIAFNQKEYLASLLNTTKTRAANSYTLPNEDWVTLGDWNIAGLPDYLLSKNHTFYSNFLEDMYYMFGGKEEGRGDAIWDRNPEIFAADKSMDIHIIEDTKISMVYLQSNSSYQNTAGYYVYETNNPPTTAADVKNYMVTFPRLTNNPYKLPLPLQAGNQIELMFPGENGLTATFPAGYSVGFFIAEDAYEDGNIKDGANIIYTTKALNSSTYPVGQNRAVALYEEGTNQMIALGFEDCPAWDQDFNDALFSVFVAEANAIDTDNMNPLPPKEGEDVAVSEGSGVVMFEDLWPGKGDYDINDIVMRYESIIERDKNNMITRVVDTFTPLNYGGTIISGFGYQYDDVQVGQVKSSVIDYGVQEPSTFMNGEESEPGQALQTMILLDNMKKIVMGEPIVVTTEFVEGQVSTLVPPYNPFIIVHSDSRREHEVHLINKRPTPFMDYGLFGQSNDKSDPDRNIYYVADKRYPFALDVPKLDFQWVLERKDINDAYPQFTEWVESNGLNNKDWYETPNSDLVEENIY